MLYLGLVFTCIVSFLSLYYAVEIFSNTSMEL
jgi:hypothetical protein